MTLMTKLKTRLGRALEWLPARQTAPEYLVYYDGEPNSLTALREACEMAPSGARVTAVFLDVTPLEYEIVDDAPLHPLLAQAALTAAQVNARLYQREIGTLILPCHFKGPALVGLARRRQSAALFIGVAESELYGWLNGFADYVIQLAPCKVVLVGS